jgi:hypothetical protein
MTETILAAMHERRPLIFETFSGEVIEAVPVAIEVKIPGGWRDIQGIKTIKEKDGKRMFKGEHPIEISASDMLMQANGRRRY